MEKYFELMMSTLSTPFVYFNKIQTKNLKSETSFFDGIQAMNKSDYNSAINNFYSSYKEDEASFESLNNTAALFNSFGRVNDSVRLFETGINKHPKNAQMRYNYGTLLFMNNAFNEARGQLEQAYSLDPNSAPISNNYALTYFSLKDFEKAKELLEETIKSDDKFELAYHNMGHVLMAEKKFEEAAEFFKKALELNENNVVTINDLACCYCNINKVEDAIGFFKKAASLNPNFRNPYFNLGYVLLKENFSFSI